MYTQKQIQDLENRWKNDPRNKGIVRPYTAETVIKLQGSLKVDHTYARIGAEKLWKIFSTEPFVRSLGAMTGTQAVQMVEAGLKAVYISGWQVAADMNDAFETYPDQSLYPVMSVPHLIQRINAALARADKVQHMHNKGNKDYFVPLIADAEAGFGGPLNTFELIKAMIESGVAAVHLEDQLASLKKCGHMGGKVLEPVAEFIEKLVTARLAMDVLDVPTLLIARTDAESAKLVRSNADVHDKPFLTGERSEEGFYYIRNGIDCAVMRAREYAPYADMVWCETSKPDLEEARAFAQGVHEMYPGKWLAYNCSPSFNWGKHLDEKQALHFQDKLAEMGYKFQFVTLAGFHTLNASMFDLAYNYNRSGMAAYVKLQEKEFEMEKNGYKAVKHQSFVGAGYFDEIASAVSDGQKSTIALAESTEQKQF